MKSSNILKKWSIKLFVLLYLLVLIACKKEPIISTNSINRDCELLKTYLADGAIDFSITIDDGLDLDEFIELIKEGYIYYAEINKQTNNEKPNENGIFQYSLAESISRIIEIGMPINNTHNYISWENNFWNPTKTKYTFVSDVFFEKRDENFFVTESNDERISIGMQYTGDTDNIIKIIDENKNIRFRFVLFSEYNTSEAEISLDEKIFSIPINHVALYSNRDENIFYNITNNCILIGIKTCSLHTQMEKEEFSSIVNEITSEIEFAEDIIFDFRDNSGGDIELLYPIINSMVWGNNSSPENDDYIANLLKMGIKLLNTKTIRNQISLNAMDSDIYNQNIDKRYINYGDFESGILQTIKPSYSGRIFVLTNTTTASAAEYFIAILQYFFSEKVILIGQKTHGAIDFGGTFNYRLPDSDISIGLSSQDLRSLYIMKNNSKWHGDTLGFYPDYWCFINDNELIMNLCLTLNIDNK